MAVRRRNGAWIAARLPNGDWQVDHIRSAVRQVHGISLTELARRHGLAEHVCGHAAREPNYDGEAAIAEALSLPANEIWPSRYEANGDRRLQRRIRADRSPAADPRHRQKHSEVRT